jgi:hypothetical protein
VLHSNPWGTERDASTIDMIRSGSISANSIANAIEANPILRARSRKSLCSIYLHNSSGPKLRAMRHVCVAQLLHEILRRERVISEINRA